MPKKKFVLKYAVVEKVLPKQQYKVCFEKSGTVAIVELSKKMQASATSIEENDKVSVECSKENNEPGVIKSVRKVSKKKEKESVIKQVGFVEEALPGGKFRVRLEGSELTVTAMLAGKLRKFRIRISIGDRVDLEMSPYDLTKARITFRHRN